MGGLPSVLRVSISCTMGDASDGPVLISIVDVSNGGVHTFFIDNQRTETHRSVIFGLRELTGRELVDVCSTPSSTLQLPVTDRPMNFTSNYELRAFTSGCYYADAKNGWQADGLRVSSCKMTYISL